jgi:hypothetical protein
VEITATSDHGKPLKTQQFLKVRGLTPTDIAQLFSFGLEYNFWANETDGLWSLEGLMERVSM